MYLGLKRYGKCDTYKEIFDYNLSVINNIEQDSLFNRLIQELSKYSQLNHVIIALDLKRYLMTNWEYDNSRLTDGAYSDKMLKSSTLSLLFNLLSDRLISFLREIKSGKVVEKGRDSSLRKKIDSQVIVDSWYDGSLETFYGKELIEKIRKRYNCQFLDFNSFNEIVEGLKFGNIPAFVKLQKLCIKIFKHHQIFLGDYLNSFFKSLSVGKFIKKTYKPRVIISGNDNGFNVITGKVSGAETFFIQNGSRGFMSDSTFKYSDNYICLGAEEVENERSSTKNVTLHNYYFGSLRMYNYFANEDIKSDDKLIYDILFIGSGLLIDLSKPGVFDSYFSIETEKETVKLLFNYANANPDKRIAYHSRYIEESEAIEKLGFSASNITFINREEEKVYKTVMKSDIILSVISTVSLEAMALNKKIGFVNLSGNEYYNYTFKELDIEFNLKSKSTFSDFIESLKTRDIDYSKYIRQNKNFVDDFFYIVDKEF